MEINPHHGIIKSLKDRINLATNEHMIKDLVNLLYESSLISSGFSIEEPATFVNRINNMIKIGLSIEDDEVDNMKEDDEKKEDGTKDGEEKEDVDVSQSNMEEID
jgi:molecular chaperone HtpG